VLIAVHSNFVTALVYFLNQFRLSLGHPTKDKKRGTGVVFVQQIENPAGRLANPRLALGPIFPFDYPGHIVGAIPVLEVNGDRVLHRKN
jgi:hypothetical protein